MTIMIDMIISPKKIFLGIKDGKHKRSIILFFFSVTVLTLIKTFYVSNNSSFGILSSPQAIWLIHYLYYFIYLLLIFFLFNSSSKKTDLKSLSLSLMSIAVIGLLSHFLFIFFHFIFSERIILVFEWALFLWVVALSIYAIRIITKTSYWKIFVIFLVLNFLSIFFLGSTSVAPYLIYLGVKVI